MSDLADPRSATLFVVGMNQRNGYLIEQVSHERHMNALFNRAGETCRGLYDEVTKGVPSPTRENTDAFTAILHEQGITGILETNVVCYSTSMSADLMLPHHRDGAMRGTHLFRRLLHFVSPRVLVAHGAGTRIALAKVLGHPLPPVPEKACSPRVTRVGNMIIFVIPSLAPPAWNRWCAWANEHLISVAKAAAAELRLRSRADSTESDRDPTPKCDGAKGQADQALNARLRLPQDVAEYLAQHHVMTLATQSADGPWAAAVFYAVYGDDLIFLSSAKTRHCTDLARDARCAATIQGQPEDWRSIQGVQIEGRVEELRGDERDRARDTYARRFPFVRPAGAPAAIVAALARVRWYRLRIARLWFIDNAHGFGSRQQFDA